MFVKTDFGKWVDEDEQDGEPVKPDEDMDPMGGMGGMGGMPGMGGMGGMPGMGGMGGMPGMGGMGGMGGMDLEQVCLVLKSPDTYAYDGSTDDGTDGRRRGSWRCRIIRIRIRC